MQLDIFSSANGQSDNLTPNKVGTVEVSDSVFNRHYNEALVHQVVIAYQANARSGNRAQKDRQQVNHSTKKPWRQKGTGNARAGMRSSPLWRGGGRIFPSSPEENFSHKVNRKMYRAGLCTILSQLIREKRILVVDEVNVPQPKTKSFIEKLTSFGLVNDKKKPTLVIVDSIDDNLHFASRNLHNVAVLEPRQANCVCLTHFKNILIAKSALLQFEALLAPEIANNPTKELPSC